jgi:hypothetical protein
MGGILERIESAEKRREELLSARGRRTGSTSPPRRSDSSLRHDGAVIIQRAWRRRRAVPRTLTPETDRVKASVRSEHAKNRLGIPPHPTKTPVSGPVDFPARYHGKKGTVYISTIATTPCVGFAHSSGMRDLNSVFSVAIGDKVKELKQVGGLG